jgi:raffinose/stachyose/melibiose transport system permease protein
MIDMPKAVNSTVKFFILIVFAILIMFPNYIVIVGSLKTNKEVYTDVFGLPDTPQWNNYIEAFFGGHLGYYFVNSFIVTGVSIVIIVLLSSMAAFALTRKFTRGSKFIYLLFIIGIAIPPQVAIIQLALQMSSFGLTNSLWALIFSYVAYELPFSVFILYGFMLEIQGEIQEAAIVDGCGNFRLYWSIMMPLSRGGIATVVIFNLVSVWNDMVFPLVLITDNKLKTLPIGLLQFKGQYMSNYPILLAAVVMMSVPLVILYLLLQKHFIRGLSQGAVKG